MISRLFWFLGLGILISNGLLLSITYHQDQRSDRNANAYRLGFQLAPIVSKFLVGSPNLSSGSSDELNWRVIDFNPLTRAESIAANGLTGWVETPVVLPVEKSSPNSEAISISAFSKSRISLTLAPTTPSEAKGDIALAKRLAMISEQVSKSGKKIYLILEKSNEQLLMFESAVYWHDEGPLSKYDFLFYVALIMFFMGLPYAAGLIFAPLDRLLQALKDKGNDATPIKADGCREISEISFAVNHLVSQLSKHMSDRLNFVAAISHDLGVPATRLRLRASLIEDEKMRSRLIEDSNEMSAMIADSLQYLRTETTDEVPRVVDFISLIQSLHQDYLDTGQNVSFNDDILGGEKDGNALTYRTVPSMFTGTETKMDFRLHGPLTLVCKPRAMRRALSNLVDNALKYGDAALLEIDADASSIVIKVTDQGPGIPEAEMEKVMQPFYRLEKSRGRGTGGTGLGLAIVNTIVRDHDGFLMMENLLKGGLKISVALPRAITE
jgi:signal transduction histidine kinase